MEKGKTQQRLLWIGPEIEISFRSQTFCATEVNNLALLRHSLSSTVDVRDGHLAIVSRALCLVLATCEHDALVHLYRDMVFVGPSLSCDMEFGSGLRRGFWSWQWQHCLHGCM